MRPSEPGQCAYCLEKDWLFHRCSSRRLKTYISALKGAVARDDETNRRFHRRLQQLESAASKNSEQAVVRRFEGTIRDVGRRFYIERRKVAYWKKKYRDLVELMRTNGVPDHVDGYELTANYREGSGEVLLRRLLGQRDTLMQKKP